MTEPKAATKAKPEPDRRPAPEDVITVTTTSGTRVTGPARLVQRIK